MMRKRREGGERGRDELSIESQSVEHPIVFAIEREQEERQRDNVLERESKRERGGRLIHGSHNMAIA